MGLESATYIKDLVPANPTTSDFVGQGDDHLRLIKNVLQNTFPALCGPALPTVGGTANAITLTYPTAPGSNLAGEIVYFSPTAVNTGATTISVNGNAALPLNNAGATLVGGELQTGRIYQAMIGGGGGSFNLIANGSLSLSGGTLTGALTLTGSPPQLSIAPTSGNCNFLLNGAAGTIRLLTVQTTGSTRWQLILANSTAEGGSNAGSDFQITRYNDAGLAVDSPLSITRSTGYVTIATSAHANLILNKAAAAGTVNQITGQVGGVARWQIQPGNGATEGGSNSGSDFAINRFTDAGGLIDSSLTIYRASGQAQFAGPVVCTSPGGQLTVSGPVATNRVFNFSTGGSGRWQHVCNASAESGSNAGSDYNFQALADSGAFLAQVWSAGRSTQIVTFAKAIVNGPSDRSLKENIAPLEDSLAKVVQLQGVSFNMIGDVEKRRHIGLIAQDVEPIVPEVIQDFRSTIPAADEKGEPVEVHKLALDYPKLTALLIEAVKTLTARVEALETQLAGVQHA